MGILELQPHQQQWRWVVPCFPCPLTRKTPSSPVAHWRMQAAAHWLRFRAEKGPSCVGIIPRTCEPCPRPFLGPLRAAREGSSGCGFRTAEHLDCCFHRFCNIFDDLHQNLKISSVPAACTFKARQVVLLLLFGIGALFSLQLPALADLGRQGNVAAVLQGHKLSEISTSAWAGLMAGCLHTLTGPDHLAALAPLCIGRPRLESAVVGALWGCGHDAGQIIFGLFFLLLKGKLKIELLQVWASRVVGITLLAIGAVGLKEAQEVPVSVLASEAPVSSQIVDDRRSTHRLKTFATGIVYGLQPDALIVILPALALPSRLAGAAYLGMFLIGTIAAMGSYTAFISSCGQALQNRVPWITQRLTIISSAVAITFGLGILFGEFFGISFFH